MCPSGRSGPVATSDSARSWAVRENFGALLSVCSGGIEPIGHHGSKPLGKAPRLESLAGTTIGLLTNGKVNADVLLPETATLFSARHQCHVLDLASKQNASASAPGGIIKELALACDFLITAMGD